MVKVCKLRTYKFDQFIGTLLILQTGCYTLLYSSKSLSLQHRNNVSAKNEEKFILKRMKNLKYIEI